MEVSSKAKSKPLFKRMDLESLDFDQSKWLSKGDRTEKMFLVNNPHMARIDQHNSHYYLCNWDFVFKLYKAGNELHQMCLKATEKVLSDDTLLARFGIHESLWPLIKHSFETQKHTITGRFDFAYSEKDDKLKMYEYNADSASALYEYGVIQQKWAEVTGASKFGRGAGSHMKMSVTSAWQSAHIPASDVVHFLIDDDDEEEYTALFVMECADSIGLTTKLIRPRTSPTSPRNKKIPMKDFVWRDGAIYDNDGVQVKHVWKTWSWSTAFDDYEEVMASRRPDANPVNGSHPYLSDILLSKKTLNVFEPLWKCIPGNKAILPLLWEMFPDHPNLLRSEWTLTEQLKSTGYASKPIVSRGGQNVSLVKPCGTVLAETSGKFGSRDMVYQELFPLPEHEGHHVLIGGWVIGGFYNGTGIREDEGLITQIDSPCPPLLIARETDEKDHDVHADKSLIAKFGTVLGYAPGKIPVYSSDYESNEEKDFDYNSYETLSNGSKVFCGAKWQCVEFARRYLIHTYGITFASIPMAFQIFELTNFVRVSDKTAVKVSPCLNNTSVRPRVGSLLIWKSDFKRTGHVAVITDVHDSYVDICEQNWDDTIWPIDALTGEQQTYARKLEVNSEEGLYNIIEEDLLGWINIDA